jgi:acetyl-CoA carboxylase biotin carboxylase subunit
LAKKILIANRGEIVSRVAKTCNKLGLEPYGVYSDADINSPHIKYCKNAVNIGGRLPSESYLRIDKIIDAAKELNCDLIHPGYGFLAENYEFSKSCIKEGFVFVGPSPNVLELSGDKARAREVASKTAPILSGKEVSNESEALNLAEKIDYPVMVKAVKGGGGRGLRVARSAHELSDAFVSSTKEAVMSFGSSRLYIEKYLEDPRHIEVQILGDNHSNIIHLGERDCSIQRRHQKLVEETPSPALTDTLREKITQTAIEIAKKMKYNNAGTIEFLFKNDNFYFMEVNSRIQVEHPITEQVTGIDIVEQQIHIATEEHLQIRQQDVRSRGHAIECRINAEHPITFAPFPGTVTKFIPPQEDKNTRIDSVLHSGYSIPSFYDSLIAKVICFGENRQEAIARMGESLSSFRISGIPTTIPFHISVLNDERFLRGDYNTSFINELKPAYSKSGEIAAAILWQLPKRIRFIEEKGAANPWARSRFVEVESLDMMEKDHLQSRWSQN